MIENNTEGGYRFHFFAGAEVCQYEKAVPPGVRAPQAGVGTPQGCVGEDHRPCQGRWRQIGGQTFRNQTAFCKQGVLLIFYMHACTWFPFESIRSHSKPCFGLPQLYSE